MVTGLAHISFIVRDLEASITFYRDHLGLIPAFDHEDELGRRFGIAFHAGARTFIELYQGTPLPAVYGQSYNHFCFEVDDIEATVRRLRERDVNVSEIVLGVDHTFHACLHDPEGNTIELHQYTADSWQTPWLDRAYIEKVRTTHLESLANTPLHQPATDNDRRYIEKR